MSPAQRAAARRGEVARSGAGMPPRVHGQRGASAICCLCGLQVLGSVSREAIERVRTRLRPAVQGCFAAARRGRPRWSGRATLELVIASGELRRASASGTERELADCVSRVADESDDFPAAPQVLRARFPVRSEARSPAPAAPLSEETRSALAAIGVDGR